MNANEKRESLVVRQKNEIIQKSGNKLTSLQQKILFYLISQVDEHDNAEHKYTVYIPDMCKVCGLNHQEYNSIARDIFSDLATPLGYIRDKDNGNKYRMLAWISTEDFELDKETNTATFRFHNLVAPYLYELKQKYTVFQLVNGVALKSKYAMSLYQLLKSYEHLESHRAIFEVDRLKILLGVKILIDEENQEWEDTYPRFYDFEKRVLKPAVKDINLVCDIDCSYETERLWGEKRVSKVIFEIHAKNPFESPEEVKTMRDEQEKRLNRYTKQE